MSRSARQFLLERLEDERSKRMIFVSPCLLNEHTCYLGGAFQSGDLHELVDGFQREGMGISQMTYPEQRACGGLLKSWSVQARSLADLRLEGYTALPTGCSTCTPLHVVHTWRC